MAKKKNTDRKVVPIVAIGASAGGLKEFETFFKSFPRMTNVAFVIIQHLDPNHKSMLTDIISRYTEMEVAQINENDEVKPGRCYVIPPNKTLRYSNGHLKLVELKRENGRQLPIDHFFESLSELREKAIAIIFSGTGSDGTRGIRKLKEHDGLILVQEPKNAQYDGMPINAVKTGVVDVVLPVADMPEVITHYIENDFRPRNKFEDKDKPGSADLKEVFDLLESRTNHKFHEYKSSTILRRIERRMLINQVSKTKEYIELLREEDEEKDALYREFLIGVTSFFRDKKVWEYLEKNIVPDLVEKAKKELRIWVPGCASGEEAYTWAMICQNVLNKQDRNIDLKIFASDVDSEAIEVGRRGVYPNSVSADIPEEYLNKFFIADEHKIRVKKAIREKVIFARQNFVQNPPYSNLDGISCRNVLIYMDASLQEKALTIFHYSLKNQGVLLLGNSESTGKSDKFYKPESRSHKIYRKLSSRAAPTKFWRFTEGFSNYEGSEGKQRDSEENSLGNLAERFVLENHVPPSIVVNPQGEILYVQGKTGKYLEIRTGAISTNISRVLKEGLRLPTISLLRRAHKDGNPVSNKNIPLPEQNEKVNISVAPLQPEVRNSDLYIIVFESFYDAALPKDINDDELGGGEVLKEMEEELQKKEAYLQTTIEELEATNEELKSANEEAQSTNEELQSANEELETSKEELQSINEELTSTNDELNLKLSELHDVNGKLNNLLRSTDVATIFLDKELKIFEFTPAIAEIMDLRESDKGRTITQFTNKLQGEKLIKASKKVLRNLTPVERDVSSAGGSHYWMRIIPYRTLDDVIEGVVLTFTDITDRKKQEEELEGYRHQLEEVLKKKSSELVESESKYRNIAENLPGLLLKYKLNPDGTDEILYVSKGIRDLYGVEPEQAVFKASSVWDRVHPEDNDFVKKSVEKSARENSFWDIEHRILLPDGEVRWVLAKGVPQRQSDGSVIWDTLKIDITDKKRIEKELKQKNDLIRNVTDNLPGYAVRYVYYADGRDECQYISQGVERILDVRMKDAEKDVGILWSRVIPEDLEDLKKVFSQTDGNEGTITAEFRVKVGGQIKWLQVFSKYVKDQEGNLIWDNINFDVTEQKQAELALRKEESKYAKLVESINEGIWQVDAEGITLFVNDRMAEILGYKKEEVIGKHLKYFMSKREYKAFDKNRERRKNGITETYDTDFIKKNGETVHTRISTTGLFDEEGKFEGAIAGVIDITKKKLAQEELKKSEEKYRAVFDNSITPILVTDSDGKITSHNEAARSYFELDNESKSQNISDLNFYRPLNDKSNGGVFDFKHRESGEVRFAQKNGNTKYALFHALEIRPDFNLSVFTDITDLKNTQDALRESERLLNETSEVGKVGGWSLNLKTGKLLWTKEMFVLHEMSPEFEPTLDSFVEMYHPQYRSIFRGLLDEAASTGKSFNFELKLTTARGNELNVRTIIRAKQNKNGEITHVYGNTQDITDLARIRTDLMRAKHKAEEASKAKTDFLAHMSHEIRTPMNGVIGFADLLGRTSLDSTQQEYVDLVNKSAKNLMDIITDILDFSKIEAGRMELEQVETNLIDLLESSIDIVAFQAGNKKLELLLKIFPEVPEIIVTDPVRLKQILANLLSNAVKFTDEGKVVLEVNVNEHHDDECILTFSVCDTGIGLSDEEKDRLFKAFSQADSATTRKYGGTGLGLIISNKLAEKMGGKIELDSTKGEGSDFYFSIKVSCKASDGFVPTEAPERLKNVLILSEDEESTEYFGELLEEWGVDFEAKEHWNDFLKEVDNNSEEYQLLILDQVLTDTSGLEVIEKFMPHVNREKQCILLLSPYNVDTKILKKCDELGVHCRLRKPIKPREFFKTLKMIDQGEASVSQIQTEAKTEGHDQIASNKLQILIAEDNHVNMLLAKSLLSQMLPHSELLEAKNGEEAIEMVKNHHPDIVFMDVRMPKVDGLQATQKIRKMERDGGMNPTLIIGLTADATKESEDKIIRRGMDEFIPKPIDPFRVQEVLKKHIDMKELISGSENGESSREASFDKNQLFQRLGADQQAYGRLIKSAIRDNTRKIAEMKKAIRNRDHASVEEMSHFLRSGSLSMSFNHMASLTVHLEKKIEEGDEQGAEEVFDQIEEEWEKVKAILSKED